MTVERVVGNSEVDANSKLICGQSDKPHRLYTELHAKYVKELFVRNVYGSPSCCTIGILDCL
jgi:hypothetical protein